MHASSWIFHDTRVRQAVYRALAEGLTLANVPEYLEKHFPQLSIPSASDLRKHLLHILLQDEEEKDPHEVAQHPEQNAAEIEEAPHTPPERLERMKATDPAARLDLEGPVMPPVGLEEPSNKRGAADNDAPQESLLFSLLELS